MLKEFCSVSILYFFFFFVFVIRTWRREKMWNKANKIIYSSSYILVIRFHYGFLNASFAKFLCSPVRSSSLFISFLLFATFTWLVFVCIQACSASDFIELRFCRRCAPFAFNFFLLLLRLVPFSRYTCSVLYSINSG